MPQVTRSGGQATEPRSPLLRTVGVIGCLGDMDLEVNGGRMLRVTPKNRFQAR